MNNLVQKPRLVLRVQDLDRSVSFYRDQLGWTLEWAEPARRVAQLRQPLGGGAVVTADPELDVRPYMDAAFEAPSPGKIFYLPGTDLPGLAQQFAARGVTGITEEVEGVFGRNLRVADPDGYIVGYFEELPLSDEDILAAYRHGPDSLEAALAGLKDAHLDLTRAPGKWSIRQTVLHVVDSDLTSLHRIKFALAEPGRAYAPNPYAQDNWAEGTDYAHRPIGTEVSLFRLAREHVLGMCAHLPSALDRTVVVNGRTVAVRSMMKMVSWHIHGHIVQIEETRRVHGK